MSTYINPSKPHEHGDYSDVPALALDFLRYSELIRGLSPRSVNGYYIDLRTFFRFLYVFRGLAPDSSSPEKFDMTSIDLDFIKLIDKAEIYEFLYYTTRERENSPATRARKLSSLKGFFKYLTNKTSQLPRNPVDDIDTPKQKSRLPKYLSLDESTSLLNNIQSDFYERDYCIVTLFLNCGMRLTELVNINVSDVKNDTLRVVGKGNKERIIYLNAASKMAVDELLKERSALQNLQDKSAMFVSKRTGKRLSARRIQQLVDQCFITAGLDGRGYSAHKLRHTAATLLYNHGHVDILALKEILGHEDVSTTQIYTHLDTQVLREAAASSPLANMRSNKNKPEPESELEPEPEPENDE